MNTFRLNRTKNIAEAKKRNWLNPGIEYSPQPPSFKYIPCASDLLLEATKQDQNIIAIDESGVSMSSSRALSESVVQFKYLGYSIRKIGACLIIIAQDKKSVVPTLRKELVDYEVHVVKQHDGRRDLDFLRNHKFYNSEKDDYDNRFIRYDYVEGVPETRIPYDTRAVAGFSWDLDLSRFYNEIILKGYDSIETKEHIPEIVRDMVAEKKLDMFLKRKKFMKTGTVAELFGVTTQTIRNWADEGKLNAIRDENGNHFFSRREVKVKAREMGIL